MSLTEQGGPEPIVEEIGTAVYTVPCDETEADGTLTWHSTTLVLVHVRSEGVVGLGYTYGAPATAQVIEDQLADVVVGRSVWGTAAVNDAMNRVVRNAGRPGLVSGALSAVDIALWDLKSRLLDLPLSQLLGAARAEVPVYGSGGFTTYGAARQDAQLRGWVEEQGIPRVKIKIGEEWGTRQGRDLERVAEARRSIGEGVELFTDANGAYSRKQAIRVARGLDGEGVTWFEEPVSSDDLEGLSQVRAASATDVTAGEYGYDLTYFGHMLAAEAVDCLQIDVTRCGGVTVWLRAAALAEASSLGVSAHCAPHLHAHVGAAAPNLRHVEWFHDHARIETWLFHGALDPSGGYLRPGVSGRPGHGLTLREDVAEPFRVR